MKYGKFRKQIKALKNITDVDKTTEVCIEVWCPECKKWRESRVRSLEYLTTFDDITIEGEQSTHKE